ncbi:MAG TPA: hypothetical protein DCM40_24735, partial [Maribacter sp.]|nr:hypothetical protein [Maribacter sp.]
HAIQQDMTITDQFDIEKKSALTGTYIDRTFESSPARSVHGLVSKDASIEVQGNTKNDLGRKIIGSVAGGTAGTTGSLLRGVKLSDGKERFWDTVMPSVVQYAFRVSKDTTFIPERNTVIIPATSEELTSRNTTIMSEVSSSLPFPFQGNPTRRPSDITTLQIGAGSSGFRIISPEATAKILFSRGWDVNINNINPESNTLNQGKIRHHVRGATGPRYGVMNYRPQYSSAVYRRDRFGQFRDLLEQRPFAKFYNEGQKDGTPGPIQIRFVQVLTNQQMDPGNVVQKETDSATANTFGAAVKKATQSRNLSL